MTKEKTVLVTGGSGFLGGWCVIELLRAGYRVRTTVRSLSREPEVRATVGSEVDPGDRLSLFAADLTRDEGWGEAAGGCDYVLHVASPFPPKQPKDPDELIVPAREGTLRVLRASLEAGVDRIVVTSSIAAIGADDKPSAGPLTEADWTDPGSPGVSPYAQSKTIAEQAAWELVRRTGDEGRLAVVNPGAILGPVLNDDHSYSIEIIERLLNGMPGIPRVGFSCVDVRDVADLQIKALLSPEAGGKRFIAVARFQWMSGIAAVLRGRLGPAAAKVPSRSVPNLAVRAIAIFDPGVREVVSQLGKKREYSHERAETLLGWSPRPIEETIVDCAQSLIDSGAVKATASSKSPPRPARWV
jgi:dihydroflavonol-4-reductase